MLYTKNINMQDVRDHTSIDPPFVPKLIRDHIPEIVQAQGRTMETETIYDDQIYWNYLKKKLIEEAIEVTEAGNTTELIEEIADLQEVISAILKLKKMSAIDVTTIQARKKEERGGFDQRTVLLNI